MRTADVLDGAENSRRPHPALSNGDDLPDTVREVLTRLAVNDHVTSPELADAFLVTVEMHAPVRDIVLGALMAAMMARGPAADDVEALLRAALAVDPRGHAEQVSGGDRPVVMLSGSGKKGVRTLNVSTPAALVAAAAGARVIKVGSAATSSAVGSRDLACALGLRERRTAEEVRADLITFGFAFVPIEPQIPVLDEVYGGRFYAPNPFSFGLAPLASPVRGDFTVFGLSHPRVDVAARVLSRFGMGHTDVLSTRLPSGHYLDEIGTAGELRWCRVREGIVGPVEVETAGAAGLSRPASWPTPRSPEEAIERTADLLAGDGSDVHRALVALNAAHILLLSGLTTSMAEGVSVAEDILRDGVALARIPIASTP